MDPLLALRFARLVGRLGRTAAGQLVDERRFADVRDAQDHGTDGAVLEATGLPAGQLRRRQGADQGNELFHPFAAFAVQGQDLASLLLVIGHPFVEDGRVGQVGLVEDDDRRLVADEGLNHGIGAAHRDTGIDEFDDDVDDLEIFLNKALGLGHVAGIPVDYHSESPLVMRKKGLSNDDKPFLVVSD